MWLFPVITRKINVENSGTKFIRVSFFKVFFFREFYAGDVTTFNFCCWFLLNSDPFAKNTQITIKFGDLSRLKTHTRHTRIESSSKVLISPSENKEFFFAFRSSRITYLPYTHSITVDTMAQGIQIAVQFSLFSADVIV